MIESSVIEFVPLRSDLKMKQLEVEEGHVPPCPIAGDANAYTTRLEKKLSFLEKVFRFLGFLRFFKVF